MAKALGTHRQRFKAMEYQLAGGAKESTQPTWLGVPMRGLEAATRSGKMPQWLLKRKGYAIAKTARGYLLIYCPKLTKKLKKERRLARANGEREEYCPRLNPDGTPNPSGYKEVTINGEVIGMCPDLPLETIAAESNGGKDSDIELMEELNRTYENAGLPTRFRRQTRAEYHYADTANGTQPKLADDAHRAQLGQYTPHWHISNNPQINQRQPRSIGNNAPNDLGFRRSGVWEWAQDKDGSDLGLVGGAWCFPPGYSVSGFAKADRPVQRCQYIGPSRLVRTQ